MARISKHMKPTADAAGHMIKGEADIKLIKELRLKRYKEMKTTFDKFTLEELKGVYNAKRSSTDKAALDDTVYLKANEKYSVMSSNELRELYSQIPANDGTFVYPEMKALAECYNKDWNKVQQATFLKYKDTSLEELEGIDTTPLSLPESTAINQMIKNAKSNKESIQTKEESISIINDNEGHEPSSNEVGVQQSSDSTNESAASMELNH